jgi:peptidoglycan hydrolase CwlO-like protein
MQRTVKAHIEDLERILHQLNEELMEQEDLRLRNALEARVRAADEALKHYRAALALEQTVHH